ncbi:zinc finger protein [Fusarium beomiforme]|uniref:Zinc finger protein n=1 Tax=Fusarium beomiforme TaxID=44412 RepID=A0A9P5DWC0_9HYPO|nr:zinc finger protein [Fusarium beomiforme]
MPFACGTCWKTWSSWRSRDQHVADTSHEVPDFECETCDRYFKTRPAVEQHMSALGHWAESASNSSEESSYYCDFEYCDEEFRSADELSNHEINDHLYCDPCGRSFKHLNSIKMHLRSRVHQGENQPCPFCGHLYVTAAGVFQHLENNGCPKAPLSRMMVYEAVKKRDPNGSLTMKLLSWSKSGDFEATERSWNATTSTFDCSLCRASFQSLKSLNQHLQSPKHGQKLYHCPKKDCCKKFSTLAAVTNHLESEQCNFMRFEDVQKAASRIFDPGRMISF